MIRAARFAFAIAAVVGAGALLLRRLRKLEREIERL
jgi:hypothetical protein